MEKTEWVLGFGGWWVTGGTQKGVRVTEMRTLGLACLLTVEKH